MEEETQKEMRRLTVVLDAELIQRLKIEAAVKDTTMTRLVEQALDRWLSDDSEGE